MPSTTELLQSLIQLGDFYGLNTTVNVYKCHGELEKFKNDWKPYNPEKGDLRRFGLSLTSLDGGLSGNPDLTSLTEHNRLNGTSLNEMSFRRPTAVMEACQTIRGLVEPFSDYLGRSHFLKFSAGGYFPYHRDSVGAVDTTFRIFLPLHLHADRDFIFLLGDQRIRLEPGRPFFINTLKEHALFSFDDESIHLILNVHLCEGSVRILQNFLHSR